MGFYRQPGAVDYAELHCHSNFSFLDGASSPEELAEEAARLGLRAVAITDHDGFYGVVRFAEAARAVGIDTVFGAELSLGLTKPQNGVPDPEGEHLLILARNPDGYSRLARTITAGQLAGGQKGKPCYDLDVLAQTHHDQWLVLTGCRKSAVPAAIRRGETGDRELRYLLERFGVRNVAVELIDHGDPLDSERNDALAALAARYGLPTVATNNVHYATPARRPLATAMAAVRARRGLDELDGWLPAGSTAHLRSGAEQAARFARYPGAVQRAAEIGAACAFDLHLVAPRLPDFPVPAGHSETSWLRELTLTGAHRRYGSPDAEQVTGAYAQIERELKVIIELGFPGYFLIVHDIVDFCRRSDILCQGRGSAANSAVCYALGITAADAVKLGLLFERFLSPGRDGPPDIDLDIESDRREEVIQYVYERYGRAQAAQVANVITYRPRSAIRDAAKALGYAAGQLDAWSKQVDHWGPLDANADAGVPPQVMALADQFLGGPRHLGIHSGGMVICDRPVSEVCPVEWGRMPGRSVLQWDKDDCAAAGLVKFDLLGLGMLSALHYAIDVIREAHGVEIDLADLPQEEAVYDMLCRADTVGVFQVESRAQMATLPRLKPRCFYDLVIEVAIIRPGPIQGGSVHPYIRRRNGTEAVTYLHPLLQPALERTLGVPLFQEQLMQIAVDVAGFTPAEADQLRQAMSAKRSGERMGRLRQRLFDGMAQRGVNVAVAQQIYDKIAAFANFGFPESHSVSFAYLVYASSWLKLHYPAPFLAALLNAQPMGFYSPQSLVADARRHGVVVHEPDLHASRATAHVDSKGAVRIGLSAVRTISTTTAEQIVAGAPYTSIADLARRTGLTTANIEALATAGAFRCLGLDRRAALWAAAPASRERPDQLPAPNTAAPPLPAMSAVEQTNANIWATGLSVDTHPLQHLRPQLDALGIATTAAVRAAPDRTTVQVAGAVIHRQRPATAQGVTFLNLEDETGQANIVCSKGLWARYGKIARSSAGLIIRGRVENVEGAVNVVADKIETLPLRTPVQARNFR